MVLGLALTPGAARTQVMDDHVYSLILFDQLEYRQTGEANPVGWEMSSWVGGDFTRLWVKSEGDVATTGGGGEAEVQALYSRLFSPFWEWQVGARVDVASGGGRTETRVLAVLGLEGLAPYWFEIEPAIFVSHKGDVSARLTATYDMFITQRAIVQPRVEVNGAVQEVPEFGLGTGFNDLSLGLRFRYEFRREYAPYVGIDWTQRFAGTADFARQAGESVSEFALVGGLRVWF
jgi:copper resistance protein B